MGKVTCDSPAFPIGGGQDARYQEDYAGMSLRDFFASVALPAVIASPAQLGDGTCIDSARIAYGYADEMVRAREGSTLPALELLRNFQLYGGEISGSVVHLRPDDDGADDAKRAFEAVVLAFENAGLTIKVGYEPGETQREIRRLTDALEDLRDAVAPEVPTPALWARVKLMIAGALIGTKP